MIPCPFLGCFRDGVFIEMQIKEITILIIFNLEEDRTAIGQRLNELRSIHPTLQEASSSEEAIDILREHKVDLVIVGSQLGEESGLDIAKKLHHSGYVLPVILLVETGKEFVVSEATKSGVEDYLEKDAFSNDTLERAIHNALEKSQLRKQVEEQQKMLQKMATTDELTNLHNRRSLLEKLTMEVQRSARYHVPLSVMLLDLDFFKSVNDNYGHLMGDQVLTTTAKTIKSQLRSTDFAGRYGGEEFCLVLTNTDINGAERIAERIRGAICKLTFLGPEKQPFQITCSIGVAEFQKGMQEPGSLLTQADQALYSAKTNGRNRVKIAQ